MRHGIDLIVERPMVGRKPNNGYEIGREAEERVFALCESSATQGKVPDWFLKIERGTQGDDGNGIDFHIHVQLETRRWRKRVPLQIKTSVKGKKNFHAVSKWRHIPCVVVRPSMNDEELLRIICEEVGYVREMIDLARRARRQY